MTPAAALLRRADGLRRRGQHRLRLSRATRAASSTGSRRPGQLFFKHFGESIFRNDLCNADVDLGDLLIHEGAGRRRRRRHAAKVFGADRTYFVLNGTSTSNKVVTNAVLQARRPGAVRPQQPQVAAPGRAGPGRRDPDLPADRAQPVRHDRRGRLGRVGRGLPARAASGRNPLVKDPRARTRPSARSASPASSSRPTTAPSTTCARCWRRSATCATTCSGTKPGSATTPFTRCSRITARCGWRTSGPEMPGLFSTQSVHKQGAGLLAGLADPQARRAHPRPAALHRAQALQRVVPDATPRPRRSIRCSRRSTSTPRCMTARPARCCGTAASSSASRRARSCASSAATTQSTGRERRGAMVLRSLRARRRDDPRLRRSRPMSTDVAWEDLPTEVIKREQQCWNFDPEAQVARLRGLRRRLRDGRSRTSSAADARASTARPASTSTSACRPRSSPTTCASSASCPEKCDLNSILFLMTPAEDESKLNTLIAKLVKFKNLWDRDAPLAEVLPTVCAAHSAALRGLHAAPGLQRDARLLSPGERQGAAAAVLPRSELPGTRDVAEGRLRGAGRQRGGLRAAGRGSRAASRRRSR